MSPIEWCKRTPVQVRRNQWLNKNGGWGSWVSTVTMVTTSQHDLLFIALPWRGALAYGTNKRREKNKERRFNKSVQ